MFRAKWKVYEQEVSQGTIVWIGTWIRPRRKKFAKVKKDRTGMAEPFDFALDEQKRLAQKRCDMLNAYEQRPD